MKQIKALSILTLVAGLTAPAHAEPTPANAPQGQIMAGPGDGAAGPLAAKSVTTIQSPRDPAKGQANAGTVEFPNILVSSVVAPNKPTTEAAQTAGVTSPRDTASGQATGTPPQSMIFTNDTIDKIELVVAQGGTSAETYREGGANDTTHRTKKPRRDRNGTRGKRQYKP